jgi:hypothetical protein
MQNANVASAQRKLSDMDATFDEILLGGRMKREDEIAALVEEAVDVSLHRHMPSPGARELHQRSFSRFADWAQRSRLSALPASGHTVAFYLMEMHLNDHALSEIAATADAIRFTHEMARQYLDWAPISAALDFVVADDN